MKTLKDYKSRLQRVLVRVDYNVPIKDGKIKDDTRIEASLPTLKQLLEQKSALVLMSHLGRPKGVDPAFSLKPVANALKKALGVPVRFIASNPASDETFKKITKLQPGEVALLENVRFEAGEESADDALCRRYANMADAFVLDAFGSAHRAHASVTGVAKYLPSYAGLLMESEVKALSKLLEKAKKPYWVVLGGAKVSDKIGVIENLLPRVDGMVIGGAMAFTFIKAMGGKVGNSLVEDDRLDLAKKLLAAAKRKKVEIVLPSDVVAAQKIEAGVETRIFPAKKIPDGWMGLDIGPESQAAFVAALKGAKTVLWNGPMGVFEVAPFDAGTLAVGQAIAKLKGAYTVIGGGDSVAAANKLGVADKFSHVSTGGGASLELLELGTLPGIQALE
jgi:phosphoglycerate kinase